MEPAGARRWLAFALYLPVLGILGYVAALGFWVLAHGRAAGAYALLYTAVLALLCRRAFAVYRGQAEAAGLWKDIAAMSVADLLLVVIYLSGIA